MAETTAVCRCRKAEKVSEDHKGKTPTIFPQELGGTQKNNGGLTEYGISIYETVPEIQPCAVYKYTAQSLRHKRQLVAGLKNTSYNAVHWSQLAPEEQIRFWEDYEAGRATTFLVEPERKRTKRRRGEHSTKPKCENPSSVSS